MPAIKRAKKLKKKAAKKKQSIASRVLALDLGKRMGFSFSDGYNGLYDFGVGCKPPGKLWSDFHVWLKAHLAVRPVNEIVYEASIHQKGHAARIINGMLAVLELVAYESGLEIRGVHQTTLKKHATGTGKHAKGKSKEAMLAAAEKTFKNLLSNDDNYIDALWLQHYAKANPL